EIARSSTSPDFDGARFRPIFFDSRRRPAWKSFQLREELMPQEFSFDVVSKTDMQEVANAIEQAKKELAQRFDFKGSKSSIELAADEITLVSDDEGKLRSVKDILETRLVKRKVSLKALDYATVEQAAGATVRQKAKIVQGIESEKAKAIVRTIKDAKLKVQASIQSDQVRVVGRSKDDLQKAMALVREQDFGIPLQFTNYRGGAACSLSSRA